MSSEITLFTLKATSIEFIDKLSSDGVNGAFNVAIAALGSASCSPSEALVAIGDRLAVVGASVARETTVIADFIIFVAVTLIPLMLGIEDTDIRWTIAGHAIAATNVGDQEGRTGASVVPFRHVLGSCRASGLVLDLVLSDPGNISVWNRSTECGSVTF